jgi:hypothetical protein
MSLIKIIFFEGKPDFESPESASSENNVRFANNLSFFEIPLILKLQSPIYRQTDRN